MSFDSGILDEFSLEARELLDDAEDSLLKLKGEENYQEIYNSVFRAFHSLKGSSGMMGFDVLQSHLHLLEDYLQKSKGNIKHFTYSVDYYLSGIDAARKILSGENVAFKYEVFSNQTNETKKDQKPSNDGIILCVFKKNEENLSARLNSALKGMPYQLKIVSVEQVNSDLFSKEKYSILISDSSLQSFKENISSKNMKKPFLYISKNGGDAQNMEHVFFFSQDESDMRLTSIVKLLAQEDKNSELYDKARGLMMYMFSDMEEYLLKNNRHEIHKSITTEIRDFIKKFGK